ncbi:protein-L-isoaspartate O-methyltransferase [Patescibacteria group bacterium]|nr:protein-L-isoaspartate O-methyltransferase [Patescibacteria group bacterium]
MDELINELTTDGYLKTERIIEAFRKIKREDFLPKENKAEASVNHPLTIGYNQTNSQPLTVAFMLELLQPKPGENIFDIGSGSGWQTALLAEIVGDEGKVIAIERIPDLKRMGDKNIAKYKFKNVKTLLGDGTRGYKKMAPYDKIIVAAAAEIGIPDILLQQLKVGGRLVIPVGKYEQDMVVMNRVAKNDYKEERYPGFQFVPLVPNEWGKDSD